MDYSKKSIKAVIVSGFISFLLMSLKVFAGIFTGSIALLSDALDNFADLLSMAGAYIGIMVSKRKPSVEYNYGYGKAQNIASLAISMLIIFAAFNIAKMGYDSFFSISMISNLNLAYFASISGIIVSLGLSFYLNKKGKELKNELLDISSKERLSDAFRSVAVLISIWLDSLGFFFAQGILAIIICFLVLYIGIKSFSVSAKGLMDGSPDQKMIDSIKKMLDDEKKIISFKDLRLKKSGPYVFGDVVIIVNAEYSLKKAHDIADDFEKKINEEFENMISFIIHVEPNE